MKITKERIPAWTLAGLAWAGILANPAHGQAPVVRGLAAGLEAEAGQLLGTAGEAVSPGSSVGTWTDGHALFTLADNPSPGDGPVYHSPGAPGFDPQLFNGHPYLVFGAPGSGNSADPGDALYSTVKYLTPAVTGPVSGHVFVVMAPALTIDRGDIFGTRSNDPELGTSNGIFVEPRFDGTEGIVRFWNGNPGGAGGYAATVSAAPGGIANDGSSAVILEWRSLTSTDADGHRAFYINGWLAGEDNDSLVVPYGVYGFGIGGTDDNPNSYNGAIAAVYIYETELTETERRAVGQYLENRYNVSGNYASSTAVFPVVRGLSVSLDAEGGQLLDTSGAAAAPGALIGQWGSGDSAFLLANNPNPGDGPQFITEGVEGFDSSLFGGRGYLRFDAPESLNHADPGDSLFSAATYLTPPGKAPVRGSVFLVFAPAITIDRGDIFGTRTNDVDAGSSNGFFVEPRFDGTTDIVRFWNGNPGAAGGYAGTVAQFSGSFLNDQSTAYILEWNSLTSSDTDGHRQFYINGELIGESASATIESLGVGGFGIGGTLDNPNAYEGAIAAVLIYEDELTIAERGAVGAWLQERFGIDGAYAYPSGPNPEPILIDFGKATLTSGGGDPVWNDIVPPVSGSSSLTGANMIDSIFPDVLAADLLDAAGNSTGISLVFKAWTPVEGATGNGNGIAGMEVAGAKPASGYPESATVDSLFINAGATVVFSLEGLDPTLAYDLKMFGTSSTTDVRISRWTVNGQTQELLTDLNDGDFAVFAGVIPSPTGVIEITYTHPPEGRPQGHWSTLEINQASQAPLDVLDGRAVDGLRTSPWFGTYAMVDGFVYTDESMLYALASDDANDLWLYSVTLGAWLSSTRLTWPYFYEVGGDEWYYLWSAGSQAMLYRISDGQWLLPRAD